MRDAHKRRLIYSIFNIKQLRKLFKTQTVPEIKKIEYSGLWAPAASKCGQIYSISSRILGTSMTLQNFKIIYLIVGVPSLFR